MERWVAVSLVLVAIGIGLLIINQVVYVPKFLALRNASIAWIGNHNASATPPVPETYGLNETIFITASIIGTAGGMLVFIGAAYLVIILIGKIVRRLGY